MKACTRGVVKGSIALSKVWLMYLQPLKEQERFCLRFWRLHHGKKLTTNAFNSYKLTKNLCRFVFRLNCHKIRAVIAFSNKHARKR